MTALSLTAGAAWLAGSPITSLHAASLQITGQITGIVHIQDVGDRTLREMQWAGTKGQSKRLEGFSLQAAGLSLEYMCHLQDLGDQPWMRGSFCGTRSQSRRLEGFAIRLRGPNATTTISTINAIWKASAIPAL